MCEVALAKLEKDAATLWEEAACGEEARKMLNEAVKNTGELLAMRSKEVEDLKMELATAKEHWVELEHG